MPDIHKHITISAPIDWVWAALTDTTVMSIWMQDNHVEVDLREGGAYKFFNGATTGHFTHILAPTLLEYTWRQSGWQTTWEDSLVRWELYAEGKKLAFISFTIASLTRLNAWDTTKVGICTGSHPCKIG